MRRRFFALGYVFFVLLTVTGLIMTFAFFERIGTKATLTSSDLVEDALADTASIKADPAFVVENIGKDLQASLENFHYYPAVNFIEQEYRSNCLSCHTPLPHNKDIKWRAFLNMHGNFIACQTCHTAEIAENYHWVDIERATVAKVLLPDSPLMAVQLVGFNSNTPAFTGQTDPGFLSQLTEDIKNDRTKQDQLCKNNYRQDLESALTCENCHNQKPVIDWSKLGYSEERALELSTLSTPSVYQKYDEFYIPSF
ncbi:MAG: hypothetical protein U9Q77_04695 [Candidatus Marinimicrobia bacterium]|nr:hypothetical protein [Candidatus Neomarinimicrobiota bacterium]